MIAELTASIAPWRRGYDRGWLTKDIVAGLAAGAVVIPQAMAYATVADLPVQVGLYTSMVPMAGYALLGGSRTLSVARGRPSRSSRLRRWWRLTSLPARTIPLVRWRC